MWSSNPWPWDYESHALLTELARLLWTSLITPKDLKLGMCLSLLPEYYSIAGNYYDIVIFSITGNHYDIVVFLLMFFKIVFLFIYLFEFYNSFNIYIYMEVTKVHMWRSEGNFQEAGSLLPSSGSQGSDSGPKAWQQRSLTTEPSHWLVLIKNILYCSLWDRVLMCSPGWLSTPDPPVSISKE